MHIAYLITAYDNPVHLGRLTEALYSPLSKAFVHLDAKSDASLFKGVRRATFIEPRHRVCWADISMVDAVMASLERLLAERPMFDRVVLISGSDYPLKSNAYMRDFFADRADEEFMNLVPMPSETHGKPISRLTVIRRAATT